VLAHRGFRRHGPENTLAGFRGVVHAANAGIPLGVELDVRRTADDVLIVVHDPLVYAPDPVGAVDRLWFADNWYSNAQLAMGDACPPRFEDVMALLADSAVPVIDIDIKERGYSQATVDIAMHYAPERVMISSHIPEVVDEVRGMIPSDVPLGMSISQFSEFDDRSMLDLARKVSADYLFLNQRFITDELVNKVHRAGKQIGAYTVNDQTQLHHFIEIGVNFPCTDYPEMAIVELETLPVAAAIIAEAAAS
jgi:glycerophosphoryl diester phosphodiesterase